jgi:hypothetical protein
MAIAASDTLRALAPEVVELTLVQAASRATLAPSIHNTQPWRFVVQDGRLELYADPRRSVPVIDPSGRQRAISCGAALFGARLALAAAQFDVVTTLLPDPATPDLLARVAVVGVHDSADEAALRLDAAADARHSNRRQFDPGPIPGDVLEALTHAADIEGAWLQPVRDLDDRITVATLTQRAEARQNADPAYHAELLAWTGNEAHRGDGVPAAVVPHRTGGAHDDIPLRDFDTRGDGELPAETRSRLDQTLFVLGTTGDGLRDWLVAGQALGRVLLELTSAGLVASILSQVAEVSSTREQLRHELRLTGRPHLLLRVGVAAPTPATPRRPLTDVVTTERTTAAADEYRVRPALDAVSARS